MSRDVLRHPAGFALGEFHGILSRAPTMERLFTLLGRAARSSSTVLIRGETGTGKDLAAHAIHALSRRAKGPFRAVNCATLSPTLLESELFGHVRGAFTGAIRDRPGLFQLADRGTVFLDEVAEMPLDIQARLLRVLEEQTFVPVGGTKPVRVDVRLVSATNRALRSEVAAGRFRADLLYRIRVVPLFLPPLRERPEDLEPLLWWFVDQSNRAGAERRIEGISRTAMDALASYSWPGNVRELRNVVEYASIMGDGPILELDDLPPELRGEPPPGVEGPAAVTVREDERARILGALARHGGRKALAARDLGISRSTLWRKLYQHRLV